MRARLIQILSEWYLCVHASLVKTKGYNLYMWCIYRRKGSCFWKREIYRYSYHETSSNAKFIFVQEKIKMCVRSWKYTVRDYSARNNLIYRGPTTFVSATGESWILIFENFFLFCSMVLADMFKIYIEEGKCYKAICVQTNCLVFI